MSIRRLSFLLALGWGLIIFGIQVWKYVHFGHNALDLAIYTQAVWSLAHGHGFASAIQGGSYLADHFEPILFLIAPLYRLWSSPLALLATQTVFLAWAVFQLLVLAQRRLNGRWQRIAILLILVNPLLWNVATYEFHGLALVTPIILSALLAYEQRQYWRWAFLLLLITFWREDLPLLVAGWAIVSRLDRRTKAWILTPLLLAVIGFWIDQSLVARAGAHHYKFLIFYQNLGSTWREILLSPFRHPVIFLANLFHPNNWGTVAGILGSVGGLCLLRPRWLLPLSLVGGQLLLLHADPRSMLRLHYLATVLPFVLFATILGLQDVPRRVQALAQRWKRIPPELYYISSACILAMTIAIVSPVAWAYQRSPFTTPVKALREAVGLVRPEDSVIASFGPLDHLANRSELYSLHYLFLGSKQYSKEDYLLPAPPDIILIDRRQWFEYRSLYQKTDKDGVNGYDRFSQLLSSAPYTVMYDRDDVVVWRKKGTAKKPILVPKASQRIQLPNIEGTLSIRPRREQPETYEATWQWLTRHAGTEPVALRWRWYSENTLLQEKILLLQRSEIPVSSFSLGERGTMKSTTTLSPSSQPDKLVLEEITFSGEYLLQAWQTFRPVLRDIVVIGSATVSIR